jgi:phosphoribosylaminoimidazolecarboxamide formyltransferase/IMP cyclohydrolase
MPDLQIDPTYELRSINRGLLKQDIDRGDPSPLSATGGTEGGWKVVSKRQPKPNGCAAFAWKACQHVKSNSIVFAQGEATVGIGGGQPNRVDCVRIAKDRAGEKSIGAVMASDAFFPFPDSVEVAAQAGITAVAHPGGSVRDANAGGCQNRMVTTQRETLRH